MSHPDKLTYAEVLQNALANDRPPPPPAFVRAKRVARFDSASDASTSASSSSTAEPHTCHLKRLPAELRNQIFLLASLESEPIRLAIRPAANDIIKRRHHDSKKHLNGLAIAKTCRQFYAEAIAIFYAENTFVLERNPNKYASSPGDTQFPLERITKFVLKISIYRRSRNVLKVLEGAIHVTKIIADKRIEIRTSGSAAEICICGLLKRARVCVGDDCLAEFVAEFHRYGLWGWEAGWCGVREG